MDRDHEEACVGKGLGGGSQEAGVKCGIQTRFTVAPNSTKQTLPVTYITSGPLTTCVVRSKSSHDSETRQSKCLN